MNRTSFESYARALRAGAGMRPASALQSALLLMLLSLMALASHAQTTISTLSSWDGAQSAYPLGVPASVAADVYGQVFTAPSGTTVLTDFKIKAAWNWGQRVTLTPAIAQWDGQEAATIPLWTGAAITVDWSQTGFAQLDFPISNLALTPGNQYVFYLVASDDESGPATASVGVTGPVSSSPSGGSFVFTHTYGDDSNLLYPWDQPDGSKTWGDTAFSATFATAAVAEPPASLQVTAPATATVGSAFQFAVTAYDVYGNVLTSYTGPVTFSSTDGAASLPSSVQLTAGTGTFQATLNTTGTQTITVKDASNSSLSATSGSIVVATASAPPSTSGPVDHLAFSNLPNFSSGSGNIQSGTTFSSTVTAYDANGKVVTGYTGTLHFTSTDYAALLPIDTALVNGVGNFGFGLICYSSPCTLTATDTSNSSLTVTSAPINVTTPVVGSLALVGFPVTAASGTQFSAPVGELDKNGAPTSSYSGDSVHFTSTDPNMSVTITLPGVGTIPWTDGPLPGGAAVLNFVLSTAGVQTITATDVTNSAITGSSNAITVTPGSPTTLVFTGMPTTITPGTQFQATVSGKDAQGNVTTGLTDVIHFTSSDGSAVLPADTALVKGSGTFNFTLNTPGAQTITATDVTASSLTATSSAVSVQQTGPAAIHVVSGSGQMTPIGSAFSSPLTVKVIDANGNAVSGATVQFSAPASGASATFSHSTATTASDGTASVTAYANTTVSSTSFTVTASVTGVSTPASFSLINQKAKTTVQLTATPASPVYGQPLTLVAALTQSSAGSIAATGTMTFRDGTTILTDSGALSSGTSGLSSSYTIQAAAAGTHNFAVVYSGDSNFWYSDARASVTVAKASSSLQAPATIPTITSAAGGTIPIQVSGQFSGTGIATPTGNISFTIDSSGSLTATIAAGAASVAIPSGINGGAHTIVVSYGGDSNYTAAASLTIHLTIGSLTPTLSFSGIPASAYQGGSFTPTLTYIGDGTASVVSQTASVCTVSSGVVSFIGAGTCTLAAASTAGASYAAATAPAQSFWVGPIDAVGSATGTLTATVTITTAGTLGQINVLTQGAANKDYALVSGGTCATGTAYTANQTCTVDLAFTPSRPGQRVGAISLTTGSGNSATVLGTLPLYGMGNGPLVSFPGTGSTREISQGIQPNGVAVDGAGNIYVTDSLIGSVLEYEAVNGVVSASPTVRTLASGFLDINGIAVDGSGNVYVASASNQVKEILAVNGVIPASPTIVGLGSGFNQPYGVAVDAAGNVYVADYGSHQVKEILAVNGVIPATPTMRTLGSGLNNPVGVAVDAAGNVYIADEGSGVKEIEAVNGAIPASPTIRTLGSDLNGPVGVAVDAAGNVYVTDGGTNQVKEIVAGSGVIPVSSTVLTLVDGLAFSQVYGVALDGSGHLYVGKLSNSGNSVVEIDLTTAPALTFANTATGQTSTDSPQSVNVQNLGNQPLSFSSIALAANPSNFALGSAGTCSTSTLLAESGICTVSASFSPTTVGNPDTDTVTLTDNSLNVASSTQSIQLSGIATPRAATTTVAQNATATYNPASQTVPLTATVMAGSSPATSGTVTFTLTNGSTTICSTTSAALVSSGVASASCTLPAALPVGNYPIKAVYNPGPGFATSSDSTHQLTVGKATPIITTLPTTSAITYGQTLASSKLSGGAATIGGTAVTGTFTFTTPATAPGAGTPSESITFTPTDITDESSATGAVSVTVNKATPAISLDSSANPAILGSSITFLATVTSAAGAPSGTVSFFDGTTRLDMIALSSGGTAYLIPSLPTGTHSITASYSGDTNFNSVTSSAVSEVVEDFTLGSGSGGSGSSGTTQTVRPGGTATYTLNIGPTGGTVFPVPLTLSLSGLPPGATGTLSPATLPAGSSLTPVTLTVQLPQTSASLDRRQRPRPTDRQMPPLVWGVLLLPFAARLRRTAKRLGRGAVLLLVLAAGAAATLGLNGCGATSGFFGQQQQTYTITVTATAGNLSRSTSVTLIVE